jgi:hypothetical protein
MAIISTVRQISLAEVILARTVPRTFRFNNQNTQRMTSQMSCRTRPETNRLFMHTKSRSVPSKNGLCPSSLRLRVYHNRPIQHVSSGHAAILRISDSLPICSDSSQSFSPPRLFLRPTFPVEEQAQNRVLLLNINRHPPSVPLYSLNTHCPLAAQAAEKS